MSNPVLDPSVSPVAPSSALAVNERQAAELLGISPRMLWAIRASGQIRAVRIGRRVVYGVDELRRFLTDNAAPPIIPPIATTRCPLPNAAEKGGRR